MYMQIKVVSKLGKLSERTTAKFLEARKSFKSAAESFHEGQQRQGFEKVAKDIGHLTLAIESAFSEVLHELNQLEVKLDKQEVKLDRLEVKLDKPMGVIDLNQLEVKLDKQEVKLDRFEDILSKLESKADQMETKVDKLDDWTSKAEIKMDQPPVGTTDPGVTTGPSGPTVTGVTTDPGVSGPGTVRPSLDSERTKRKKD